MHVSVRLLLFSFCIQELLVQLSSLFGMVDSDRGDQFPFPELRRINWIDLLTCSSSVIAMMTSLFFPKIRWYNLAHAVFLSSISGNKFLIFVVDFVDEGFPVSFTFSQELRPTAVFKPFVIARMFILRVPVGWLQWTPITLRQFVWCHWVVEIVRCRYSEGSAALFGSTFLFFSWIQFKVV